MLASPTTIVGDLRCLPALQPAEPPTPLGDCPRSLPGRPAGAKASTKSSANFRPRPASTCRCWKRHSLSKARGTTTDEEETKLMFADANCLAGDFDLAFYQLSSFQIRDLEGL